MGRTRRGGYTLLEMMLVVAVIAILMLVLVGSMDDLTPWSRTSAAAREIAAAIRFVASEAAATGKSHLITYDFESQRHWVVLPRSDEEGPFKREGKEDDTARRTLHRDLPEGVRFVDVIVGEGEDSKWNKGEIRLDFGAFGFAPAHNVHIRYREDEALTFTISVNPVTAETTIHEGYENPDWVSDVPKGQ